MLRLIIQDDEGHQTVIPFAKEEISVGRQVGNTIRLTERNVSRHHARLYKVNGAVVVEDLNSSNGTLVNGQPISGRFTLQLGDRIRIGNYGLSLQLEEGAHALPSVPSIPKLSAERTLEATPPAPVPVPFEPLSVGPAPTTAPKRKGLRVAAGAALVFALAIVSYQVIIARPAPVKPVEPSAQPASLPPSAQNRSEATVPEPPRSEEPPPPAPSRPERTTNREVTPPKQASPPRRETKVAVVERLPPEPKPKDSEQLYEEGTALFRRNQFPEAAEALKECLRLEPTFARCHRMLGATYARMKEPELGAEHYRRFVQLAPDDPEAAKVRIFLEQYEAARSASKKD